MNGKAFISFPLTKLFSALFFVQLDATVAIYEVSQQVLLKHFCLTNNRSMDGTVDKLNSKNNTPVRPEEGWAA
jgi:hypothetical protein